MIIKDEERKGVFKILNFLTQDELDELVLTVTKRLITKFESKECYDLILNYSEDVVDLLKKRKIKKEYLFNYLKNENVFINVNSTKSNIIKECLKYWGSDLRTENIESMEIEIAEDLDNEIFSRCIVENHNNLVTNSNYDSTVCNFQQVSSNSTNKNEINQQSFDNNQLFSLSLKFGEWFYTILPNVNNPNIFDLNNFWNDSQLKFSLMFEQNIFEENACGNELIIDLLRKIILCKLEFKPNLLPQYNGIRSNMEEHGCLKIIVSGVVHLNNEPIGFFDHFFGLLSDSNISTNNWRIKYCEMKLKLSKIPSELNLLFGYSLSPSVKNF